MALVSGGETMEKLSVKTVAVHPVARDEADTEKSHFLAVYVVTR